MEITGNEQKDAIIDKTVTISLKDSLNCEWIDGSVNELQLKWTIAKVILTPSVESIDAKEYDGTTSATGKLTLSGAVNNEKPTVNATFVWTNATVGTTTFTVNGITLDTSWSTNYVLSIDELTSQTFENVKINKISIEIPEKDNRTFVFTGQAQTYQIDSNEHYTIKNNIQTDVGTYTVTISIIDKVNYEWSNLTNDDLTFEFIILPKEIVTIDNEQKNNINVVITSENGFALNTTIEIKIVEQTNSDNYKDNIKKNEKIEVVYDIKILLDNVSIQPNGTINIKMAIPEPLKGKEFRILHVHGENISEVEYTMDDDNIYFSVDELSEFVFVSDDTGSIVWLIIVLLIILLGEVGLIAYKVLLNRKAGKLFTFVPFYFLAFIPGGQIAFLIILIVLCLLGGACIFYLFYFREYLEQKKVSETGPVNDDLPNVDNKDVPTDFEINMDEVLMEETQDDTLTMADVDEEDVTILKEVEEQTGLAVLVRYRKSFIAKYIQTSDEIKTYYKQLKNEILSYNGVISRVSWNYDSINFEKEKLAKFNVSGKTLCLYLAINPNDYGNVKFKVNKVESKKYQDTPYLYQIKNDKELENSLELVKVLMDKYELKKGEQQNKNYYLPYETIDDLVIKGLIKEFITKVKYEDYLQTQEQIKAKKK